MFEVCLPDNSVLKYRVRLSVIKGKLILIPILFLIFASCSQESSLLVSSEEVSLETVEDGSFLLPGDQINVVLTEVGSRSTLVKMILKDEFGSVVAEAELDPETLKGLGLPMELPSDLEEGVYYLHFEIMDNDLLLYEDVRYIYVVPGEYRIISLETFPPGINPGDTISARVSLSVPEESDPWIRWTLDDEIIKEGVISGIGVSIRFTVPEKVGVYTLKAELFPEAPGDDQYSTVFRHSDLFVTSLDGDLAPWKFTEDRTYQYFIDFSDGLTNRMNPDDEPVVIGSPRPYSQGSFSGISFGMEDGLIFNQYALPLSPDGKAGDFLLTMAFSYSSLPESGVYNLFRTGNESTYFSVLYLADTREFLSEFRSYSRYFHSSVSADEIRANEAVFMEVQYTAGQGIASLSWKNDGKTLTHDEGVPVSSLVKGKTYIGMDGNLKGFPMNWYTLGVSTPNSQPDAPVKGKSAIESVNNVVMLYEKSGTKISGITIENAELGDGLATLEIQTERGSTESWVFVLKDERGITLYSMNSSSSGIDSTVRDRIVLSLSNDPRGMFLSTSLDAGMSGPFDYQKTLNFEIYPENGASETLEDILSIRLFRD